MRTSLALGSMILVVLALPVRGGDKQANPWGISASASSMRNPDDWLPKMAAAGVATVRLFPEWRAFEPARGKWQWDHADALVKSAANNKIEINAILMGSPPAAKKVHAFPMDDLDGWSRFVGGVVDRYKGRIRHWEVWNEGNGGFNDDHHTTSDYARLAAATYAAAKKADPKARVGLSVASFDAPYLNQAIRAMAKAGQPNRFDFLCIHPYEIADGLADPDGEIPFLWMTRLLRDMLKASAPERAEAEIWITEVGRRVVQQKGHVVT
jgi:polysaccharide biosynthesis protein PslG